MKYPTDSNLQVELDIFKARKMTEISIWRMGSKKFKNLESAYRDARNDERYCIDLRVTLEGDPKFKNLKVEVASGAQFARDDMDREVRNWVLDQGLRSWKHVANNLGFEMAKDKLTERLSGKSSSHVAPEADAAQPKLIESYDTLLT